MYSTSEITKYPTVPDQNGSTNLVALTNLALMISRAISMPLDMTGDEPEILRKLQICGHSDLDVTIEAFAQAWQDALEDRDTLSVSYARLFLGPFEILASPYASFYLEENQQLMGEVSAAVARAYADAGLKPGAGPREAPDHVALEWEFVYYLMHQYLTTNDMEWLNKRDQFVKSHMSRWLPDLCGLIENASLHPFYEQWTKIVIQIFPFYSQCKL
jgi:TorA maturation chaperone TorD